MNILSYSNTCPINVVIMAGGKGTRLKSLTTHRHKSLIEIADKPIILHLIEHLISFGLSNIYVSVGHFSNHIINYLGDGSSLGSSIEYIHETVPMGSIGALSLKKDWACEHFLVINGDIYTNFNARDFITTYFEKNADMGVLTFENNIEVPWGVFNLNPVGEITHFIEKPRYPVHINAGIYLFNKHILKLINSSSPMEGWELIQTALGIGYKVLGIPLNDGYWIDIGTTETLLKAQELNRANTTDVRS